MQFLNQLQLDLSVLKYKAEHKLFQWKADRDGDVSLVIGGSDEVQGAHDGVLSLGKGLSQEGSKQVAGSRPHHEGVGTMKLDAAVVHETLKECLYTKEELEASKVLPPEGTVMVHGLVRTFGLHPERVKERVEKVREMLGELRYLKEGVSFLTLCYDKDERQWGEHMDMEALVVLGIATELLVYCLPKEQWHLLPGQMPYVMLKP